MAWNTTITFTTGSILTAAQLNAQIGAGGNIDQGSTALVTTAGDMTVATGSKAMARLAKGSNGDVLSMVAGSVAWAAPASASLDKGTLYTPGYLAVYDGNAGNPVASGGSMRMVNAFTIKFRNAANSADVIALSGNSSNDTQVGDPTNQNNLIFNAPTGKGFNFNVNSATIWGVSVANGLTPANDNQLVLGAGGNRYTAVYAVNGTIQTSSGAAKHSIEALSVDEALRVVLATRIVRFQYHPPVDVDEDAPPRLERDAVHVGFIAEEVDPLLTLGKGPELGVSAQSTASIALAAIQALAARLDRLEARLAS